MQRESGHGLCVRYYDPMECAYVKQNGNAPQK